MEKKSQDEELKNNIQIKNKEDGEGVDEEQPSNEDVDVEDKIYIKHQNFVKSLQ